MTFQLGLLLALACALATNAAFLCKHRGAVAAPRVDIRRPLRSAAGLFASTWWTLGFCVAVFAWMLHVAALSLAPLSVVQAVISGGFVLLAVLGDRFFGLDVDRREWWGLALAGGGLGFLALTIQTGSGESHSSYSLSAMVAFESALIGFGTLLLLSHKLGRIAPQNGLLLGAAAGILFGVSDIAIKALVGTVPANVLSIISPWTAAAIAASIVAFYASARALQIAPPIAVIAMTSVAANVSAILGGIIVFGDPVGSDAVEVIVRSAAFALVIAAAALMPAPLQKKTSPRTAAAASG
jgi:drug/metabolite transporter (DMT)-like permease